MTQRFFSPVKHIIKTDNEDHQDGKHIEYHHIEKFILIEKQETEQKNCVIDIGCPQQRLKPDFCNKFIFRFFPREGYQQSADYEEHPGNCICEIMLNKTKTDSLARVKQK
jgi:hypothetical protein